MTHPATTASVLIALPQRRAREALKRSLERDGRSVFAAVGVDDGFDALYAHRPAMVVVDMSLQDRAALKLALAASARGAKVVSVERDDACADDAAAIRVFAGACAVGSAHLVRDVCGAVAALAAGSSPDLETAA